MLPPGEGWTLEGPTNSAPPREIGSHFWGDKQAKGHTCHLVGKFTLDDPVWIQHCILVTSATESVTTATNRSCSVRLCISTQVVKITFIEEKKTHKVILPTSLRAAATLHDRDAGRRCYWQMDIELGPLKRKTGQLAFFYESVQVVRPAPRREAWLKKCR